MATDQVNLKLKVKSLGIWHKVPEHLPEFGENVLVFIRENKHKGRIEIGRLVIIHTSKNSISTDWYINGVSFMVPTHWQELPNVPNDIQKP